MLLVILHNKVSQITIKNCAIYLIILIPITNNYGSEARNKLILKIHAACCI